VYDKATMWFIVPSVAIRNLAANFDWREKSESKDTLVVATPQDLEWMSDEELLKYVTQ
jgi:hypothetical protein